MAPKKYDLLLLLAGEDLKKMPRTALALDLYRAGKVGNILVSGSVGCLSEHAPLEKEGDHIKIANLLNLNGVHASKIFTDYRPVDTLGNFVFPYYQPLQNNPNPNELETLFLTEEGHMQRAVDCAKRVISEQRLNHIYSAGEYQADLITKLWHKSLMVATHDIEANPGEAYHFLMTRHPVYREGWFELSGNQRKREIIKFIFNPSGL